MELVDTSAWIEQLRKDGDSWIRERVEALLGTGEAAWCPMVRLELWNGARGDAERSVLGEMDNELPILEIAESTWIRAVELATSTRKNGITIPATDLLVAACAQTHGVGLLHYDNHFDLLDGV